jgi:hypothetical protein
MAIKPLLTLGSLVLAFALTVAPATSAFAEEYPSDTVVIIETPVVIEEVVEEAPLPTDTVTVTEPVDETPVVTPDTTVQTDTSDAPAEDVVIPTPVVDPIVEPTYEPQTAIAIYLYYKLDVNKPARWSNSGTQTLIDAREGTDYYTTFPGTLPDYVCGPGWAVQQDPIIGGTPADFVDTIAYPNGYTTNSGVVTNPIHQELSALVTVPDCYVPPTTVAAQPSVQDSAICGAWTVQLSNTIDLAYDQVGTPTTFVIDLGNNQTETLVVAPNQAVEPITYEFSEDGGDFVGNVYADGVLIFTSPVITSDCEVTVVATPTVSTPNDSTPEKAGTLALTGADANTPLHIGLIVLTIGLALMAFGNRRRQRSFI